MVEEEKADKEGKRQFLSGSLREAEAVRSGLLRAVDRCVAFVYLCLWHGIA